MLDVLKAADLREFGQRVADMRAGCMEARGVDERQCNPPDPYGSTLVGAARLPSHRRRSRSC